MNQSLLLLAAGLTVITALTHSIVGERRLIGPIVQLREGVLARPLARQVLRFAWHFTSALGFVAASALWLAGTEPSAIDPRLIVIIGLVLLGSGLLDAIYTRGKHIGWPLLTAAGASALAALI